jgi:predicted nucleic acid-binding protein
MLFLLDTNAISDLMQGQVFITSRLRNRSASDEAITSPIVVGEIPYGIGRLAPGIKRQQLDAKAAGLFQLVPTRPMPSATGENYATIKLHSQRSGLTLKENDLWIAATALSLAATLITRDNDFSGIPGLIVQDWTV